jgi:predicted nucleic acid-binding protein
MTFNDIAVGAVIFIDSNTLVYHFNPHPVFGPACTRLLERIENQDLQGYTSAHVLSEMAHRLMTLEAAPLFGWPVQGIAQRLKRHPNEVQQLSRYRQALDEIPLLKIHILPVSGPQVSRAADVCRQTGLLSSDALIAAVMLDHGLTHLASNDADFDRVPGIVRYAPV